MKGSYETYFKCFFAFCFSAFSICVQADEPCLPCGQIITNAPLPTSSDCNQVAPFQNFIATSECCPMRASWGGFYLGTGIGAGTIDYNLKIPGIALQENGKSISSFTNDYFIEYATIGYSHVIGRFFIAGELGYYYHSTTKPIFYEDPSFLILTSANPPVANVTVRPCSVRLDLNAHNHVALDFMPGFAFTPRLAIFGRVGLEFTSYTWQRRFCFPAVTIDEIPLFDLPIGLFVDDQEVGDVQTDNVLDLRLGAGISFAVCPHVNLNLNYVHVVGSKATFNPNLQNLQNNIASIVDLIFDDPITDVVTPEFTTLAAQNKIDPSRNELLFGVTFTF